MAKYLSFRDGGKTDQEGIAKPFDGLFTGEVKTGLATSQLGSPGMGVAVSTGSAFIPTGNGYPYHVWTDASESVTIATADGSNPRLDLIVAYVDLTEVDDTDPNNPTAFKIVAVAGTPAGSPAQPDSSAIQSAIGASNPYIILSRVAVGAGVTTITNANVTDLREMVNVTLQDGTVESEKLKATVAFSAYKSTAANATNTTAKVTLQTELYDEGSNFDNGANSRFTAPVNGIYHFDGGVRLNNASATRLIAVLYKNGVEQHAGSSHSGDTFAGSSVSADIMLAAGDYVELWYTSSSTNAFDVGAGKYNNYLTGHLIGTY